MKPRVVIYTAIIGDYDELSEPKPEANCDFVCFTDLSKLQSKHFEVRKISRTHKDPVREARRLKLLPHLIFPDRQISVWMDGCVRFRDMSLYDWANKCVEQHGLAVAEHPDADDIYCEYQRCLMHNKDEPEVMRKQVERYRTEGLPAMSGMVSSQVLVRRHNLPSIIDFDQAWWAELENGSRRDQLSFNYVAWKQKLNFHMFDRVVWNKPLFSCKYFEAGPHK